MKEEKDYISFPDNIEEIGEKLLVEKKITLKQGVKRLMGLQSHRGVEGLVLMQPMNKELGPNVQWAAERYPTELPRSEPKGGSSHSSLTTV